MFFVFRKAKNNIFYLCSLKNNIKTQYYDKKTFQHVTERIRNDGT